MKKGQWHRVKGKLVRRRGRKTVPMLADDGTLTYQESALLAELQQHNDSSDTVDDLIRYAEANSEKEFPLEKLAKIAHTLEHAIDL